ncbi:MAG TPA: helix-turn-helix domain-containing protein [Candidatus Nanoarchaeia archaeon]|nr:helix-turn-helix domain-containing protein [Candidatus Nanoarchaeia archaeon]
MDLRATLEQFGLTKLETQIYLTLLDIGPALAGTISRRSGIHRRNVYDAAERLIRKGLVGYIQQNNRRHYAATNPEQLLTIINEQAAAINHVLPKLQEKYNQTHQTQETLFYKGKKALKNVFEDQLNHGKEILVLGASTHAKEQLQYYLHWYTKNRVKQRKKLRLIYHQHMKEKIPYAETRYLPLPATNIATNIYGDKVAIINWQEKPFVILIHNKDIADNYKAYFEQLWKTAKK